MATLKKATVVRQKPAVEASVGTNQWVASEEVDVCSTSLAKSQVHLSESERIPFSIDEKVEYLMRRMKLIRFPLNYQQDIVSLVELGEPAVLGVIEADLVERNMAALYQNLSRLREIHRWASRALFFL